MIKTSEKLVLNFSLFVIRICFEFADFELRISI